MFIISRNRLQKLLINGNIEITILDFSKNRVRFGIKAPKEIRIHTNLKASPVPERTEQVVEIPSAASPLDGLPAAVGIGKRRWPTKE
jgi:carbon storage regulator CsrA